MKKDKFAIIEIGSNNTKTHIYENKKLIYSNNITIEFKKNYSSNNRIDNMDMKKLCDEIKRTLDYTNNIYVFGCSIFRNISKIELDEINKLLYDKYNLRITVISQTDEALLTAFGCYGDIEYDGNICIFIGGGGSTELLVINNKKIVEQKYLDFGVVDITKKFETLKDDIPTCSFDEVYEYIDSLIGNFSINCNLLILAGGDHLYWYNNAEYELLENNLYSNDKQEYMITDKMNDKYDRDALITSLNRIRYNSNNPLWFDGSRAMKIITNVISHRVNAKYIIPTKINMEDGLKNKILNNEII